MAGQQFVIQKAVKAKKKARIALDGPTGSGKTYTALAIAQGLADEGKIGLIDTEKSSADLYGNIFDFDTIKLQVFSPQNYIGALEAFGEAGYAVVIIDSWSHAWEGEGGALEMVDAAAARNHGNSFAGWREITPLHNKMVGAILDFPGHVIATMRAKMEYVLEANSKGKMEPKKVGMAPIQRAGVEYEFDIVADLDIQHNLMISKTRLPIFDGQVIKCADRKFGRAILDDLNSGVDAPTPAPQPEPDHTPTSTPAATETAAPWQWNPEHKTKAAEKMVNLDYHLDEIQRQLDACHSDADMRELSKRLKKEKAERDAPAATPEATTQAATPTSDPEPQPEQPNAPEAPTVAPAEVAEDAGHLDFEEPAEKRGQRLMDGAAEAGGAGEEVAADDTAEEPTDSPLRLLKEARAMVEADAVPAELKHLIKTNSVVRAHIASRWEIPNDQQDGLLMDLGLAGWSGLSNGDRLALCWLAEQRAG